MSGSGASSIASTSETTLSRSNIPHKVNKAQKVWALEIVALVLMSRGRSLKGSAPGNLTTSSVSLVKPPHFLNGISKVCTLNFDPAEKCDVWALGSPLP